MWLAFRHEFNRSTLGMTLQLGGIARRSWNRTFRQRLFHVTTVHRLLLEQMLSQCCKRREVVSQQCLSTLVLFGHETLDFRVDHLTSLRTQLAIVLDRSPQVLKLLTRVAHGSKLFAHTKFR